MTNYENMAETELMTLRDSLDEEYRMIKARGLDLNMARGKPSAAQLDLSLPMLTTVQTFDDCFSEDGTDCRNYGVLNGLPEAQRLMATMLDDDPARVVICGNSSLAIMYSALTYCWVFGTQGCAPWCSLPEVTWLCPVPGYDRHFAITEAFGIKMVNVPLTAGGPDMDVVERLVADDSTVKGIWCCPKYSNPTGITYDDETVRRLAAMPCAAPDFRIFWDNAYSVHHLNDDPSEQDQLLDIAAACASAGNPDRCYKFASTSKVTFPGAGIAAFASSEHNVAELTDHLKKQTIGYDKLNQLRHVRFLRDADGIATHMRKHAALLRPKFSLVEETFTRELVGTGCSWTSPRGGYFISFTGPAGTAKRIVSLAKEAGVTLTGAGAPFPYHRDPDDAVIRIAPSLPPIDELKQALEVFTCCAKLACVERILARRAENGD